ncbi:unnamed protein product [Closterium sp. Yama58-4]|nr:unnamed protein product [Closterium sp. Yama58-4]
MLFNYGYAVFYALPPLQSIFATRTRRRLDRDLLLDLDDGGVAYVSISQWASHVYCSGVGVVGDRIPLRGFVCSRLCLFPPRPGMWKRKFSAAGADASTEPSASRGRGAGGSGSGSSGFGFVRSGGSAYTPPVNPVGSYGGFGGGGGSYAGYRGGSGRRSLPDDDDDDIADIEYRDDGDGEAATTATGYGEDDEDEGNRRAAAAAEEEEEDPLDAFMSGIERKVKEDAVAATSRAAAAGAKGGEAGEAAKPEREDWRAEEEEADLLDSFLRARKSAGLSVAAEAVMGRGYDSDEEVYAAAKAVDAAAAAAAAAAAGAAGGAAGSALDKMDALGHVDHSAIEYDEFDKDFYQEHPDVTAMSAADVAARLASLSIRTSGFDVPRPISAFAHAALPPALMGAVRKHGYSAPTPIQSAALPVILSGRDVIGVAKTGSGKTAAFVLPLLVHVADQPRAGRGEGPIALICAPTRELAAQIHAEARRFAKPLNLRVAGVFGGMSKFDQFKELKGGVEVVVATPGRLIDMLKMKALSLRRCTFLVLDEADMMFHLGFEPQVRAIVGQIRPDRQTLLFSATMPRRIERLARDILTHPVRITVGEVGAANADVRQRVVVLPEPGGVGGGPGGGTGGGTAGDDGKVAWLLGELGARVDEGDVLVFAGTKLRVDAVTAAVAGAGFKVGALHGDLDQSRRSEVVRQLKKGELHVVVATDVAARGLDIRSIKTVINLDSARDMDAHVHRVGRTGRAGDTDGVAISVVTGKEARFAGELVGCLVAGGQEVPPELLELAMKAGPGIDTDGVAVSVVTGKEARFAGELVGCLVAGGQEVPPELLELAMKFKSSFVAASAPHPHDPVPDLPPPPPPPPSAPAAFPPPPSAATPAAAGFAAPQAAVTAPAWGASGAADAAAGGVSSGGSMGADVVAAAIAAAAAKAAAIAASLGLQAPGGVGGGGGVGGAAAGGMAMGGGVTGMIAGMGASAGGVDGYREAGGAQLACSRYKQKHLFAMSITSYNGGAVVAMKGDKCVAIACDRRFGVQLQTLATDFNRVFQMHPRLFLGLAGLGTDVQTLKQRLEFRHKLFALREDRVMPPATFAHLVSSILYERRFGPYFIEPVIAGLEDDGTPFICATDLIGAYEECPEFGVAGTADESLFGACESYWQPGLQPEELFETISQALLAAVDRDALSGWGATVHVITLDKIITRTLKGRMD